MEGNQHYLNLKHLQHFLGTVAYIDWSSVSNVSLPVGKSEKFWLLAFKKLGFIHTDCELAPPELRNAPLLFAVHHSHGPILIRTTAKMISLTSTHVLVLNTGEELKIRDTNDFFQQLESYQLLIDAFSWSKEVKAEALAEYINTPMKRFLSQFMKLNFAVSMMVSILFMSGMDTLKFIVPTQSAITYMNVGFLILAVITSFVFGKYLMQRAQSWIDSVSQERLMYLRLSMFWALPVDKQNDIAKLCRNAQHLANLKITYRQMLGSCFALIPLAISIFSRAPFALVVVPIILTVLAAILSIRNRETIAALSEQTQAQLIVSQQALNKFIQNVKPDLYYKRIDTAMAQYQQEHIDYLASDRELKQKIQSNLYHQHFFQGLALSVAMLVSAHLVSDDVTGFSLSISSAYMILYLVNTVFRSFPKIVIIFDLKTSIDKGIASMQQLMMPMCETIEPERLRLTALSIRFEQVKLPHDCHFKDCDSLTTEFFPHSIIDIRGASGAGKSTLIRCILGSEQAYSGEIRIAGVASHRLTEPERKSLFSYLGQESRLFIGSLKDNLMLFASENTSERELWNALDTVQLGDKAKQLPLGLDTPVMSAAASFSTGECQRILLAQLLFKSSKVLILDEALSGIPEQMELQILTELKSHYEYIIRVSHRVELQHIADEVIELSIGVTS
ncbi:ATP-binding cassette domain-containing protein [Parashewanella curva]|uniref:ATP-binding cassette domain-containing protein n=1 Tax=Parashewanella curva TaxID=2338552 RepID=A0A3L8PX82_9GAMM|nr:ATP-binding cassette domain-containing protein [Parashewanella curva]RLV59058.1 ATP-binding cassette domain-containing protein [Parashewanella curva]